MQRRSGAISGAPKHFALVVLLVLAAQVRAVEVKPVIQGTLVGAGVALPLSGNTPGYLVYPLYLPDFRALELSGGARFGEHWGVCAGTEFLRYTNLSLISGLPVRCRGFYDLALDSSRSGLVAYAAANWYPLYIGVMDEWSSPAVGMCAGVSYTWYCLTPRLEVNVYRTLEPGFSFFLPPIVSLEIDLGGTYVLGRRRVTVDD